MKFIVFWTLCTWVTEPCKDNVKIDKFGRTISIECNKEHGKFDDCKVMSKEFIVLDSAVSFYNDAMYETEGHFPITGSLYIGNDHGFTLSPITHQIKDVKIKAIKGNSN